MKILNKYKNGNAKITIWSDGTREIEFPDGEEINLDFPLSIDLCITKYCDRGCKFCYANCSTQGKHGDIMNLKFIDTIPAGVEIACLTGDTITYGKTGAIEIKDLKIGDYIFDSEYKLRKIIDIKKKKDYIKKAKLNKGYYIKSTKDHPFLINGNIVELNNTLNKKIDILNQQNNDLFYEENNFIDMKNYLTIRNNQLKGSTGGKELDDGKIFLGTNSPKIQRYIPIDKDLMWLYGLWIAQGSATTLVINGKKNEQAEEIKRVWHDKTGITAKIYKKNNALIIDLLSKRLCESIFVNFFKVGKGARNKSLEYLFRINDKELVKNAIIGLYDGDGCYRYRKNSRIASYKTSSKKLAYELSYILNKFFNIKSSFYYGINKKRVIENRILEPSDYYMLDIYNSKDLKLIFESRFSSFPEGGHETKFLKVKEIENYSFDDVYDIYLEDGTHIFPINGYILTHNCGGGSATSHPDLKPFLKKIKEKGLIANMTVSQGEFIDQLPLINELIEDDLIYGLGISFKEENDQLWKLIAENENCVVHLIAGIHDEKVFNYLSQFGLKILILGYKDVGRGFYYHDALRKEIDDKINWLKSNLEGYLSKFKVVSFDNLAIIQLSPQGLVSKQKWDELFQGTDGNISCYIDAVKEEAHVSSLDERGFKLKNDIKDIFKEIKELKNSD